MKKLTFGLCQSPYNFLRINREIRDGPVLQFDPTDADPGSPVEARHYRYPQRGWVQPDAIARGIPPDASEKARKLEDLGYATLTAPDRLSEFFVQMPAFDQRRRGDEKLRVGTNVLNNDFRHSVVVAREAATVDLLTVGRLRTAEDLRGILARSQHDPVNAPEAVNAIRFHLPTPIFS